MEIPPERALSAVVSGAAPLLAPNPQTPAPSPLSWAVAAWVRREIGRALFERTPAAVQEAMLAEAHTTSTLHDTLTRVSGAALEASAPSAAGGMVSPTGAPITTAQVPRYASQGLVPQTRDGFDMGNYENFAPIYAGSSSAPVPLGIDVGTDGAITAPYSLFWRGSTANTTSAPQRWILASNLFYAAKPYTVSVEIQFTDEFLTSSNTTEVALIGAMSSYSRQGSTFSGRVDALRVQRNNLYLTVNGDPRNAASAWTGGATVTRAIPTATALAADTPYIVTMSYAADGTVTATMVNKSTGVNVLGTNTATNTLKARSTTVAESVGLLLDMPGVTTGSVAFDNFGVQSQVGYQVRSGVWTRSPQLVVLPRTPDVPQGEGYWVGAGSGFFDSTDGVYKMWYRLRSPSQRGYGYGYSTSADGITWVKYTDSQGQAQPVFMPAATDVNVQGVEKISVRKTDDGTYQAWYTALKKGVDNGWYIGYATSSDGIAWNDRGPVLGGKPGDVAYYKDAEVVIVDGVYNMYVMYDPNRNAAPIEGIAVFTSADGVSWKLSKQIFTGLHSHPGVFYAKDSKRYWLFHDMVSIKAASSSTPTGFTTFSEVFKRSAVGIDDGRSQFYSATDTGVIENNGVNYPFFLGDEKGQLATDRNVLMYYQARHTYMNNQTDWAYAQDGKVALAGRFEDLFVNVSATVASGGGSLVYSAFPLNCQPVTGLSINPRGAAAAVLVTSWTPAAADTIGALKINVPSMTGTATTPVAFSVTGLQPSRKYQWVNSSSGQIVSTSTSSATGVLTVSVPVGAASRSLTLRVAPQ